MNDLQPLDEISDHEALKVSLSNFEGPLDLLLQLARDQKFDLADISISALADQYLAFIRQAQSVRLEIAADYLVMAAWLAYLKSRLLLPEEKQPDDAPLPEAMADALRFHLQRLSAMQEKSQQMQHWPQLGSDVFALGQPQPLATIVKPVFYLNAGDLLLAIGRVSRKKKTSPYAISFDRLLSLEEAAARLRATLGYGPDWALLSDYVPEVDDDPLVQRSARACTFAAALEMAKNGDVILQQSGTYQPIFIKRVTPRQE